MSLKQTGRLQILRPMLAQRMTLSQMAKRTGWTRSTVAGILHRAGLKTGNAQPDLLKGPKSGKLNSSKVPAEPARKPKALVARSAAAPAAPPMAGMTWTPKQAVRPSVARAAELYKAGHQILSIASVMKISASSVNVYLTEARNLRLLPPTNRMQARAHAAGPDRTMRMAAGPAQRINAGEPIGAEGEVDHFGRAGCQWIDGDPLIDDTMCGAQRVFRKPYCPAHCDRAYTNFGLVCEAAA